MAVVRKERPFADGVGELVKSTRSRSSAIALGLPSFGSIALNKQQARGSGSLRAILHAA
jgi:hypothetical protein